MTELFISISIFLLAHIIPSHKAIRHFLVHKMGERLFMSVYGVISLILFIWLLRAYFLAPYIELWIMTEWMRHVVLFVMFWVSVLLVCTFSQPNPFSIGIGGKNFNPAEPGIIALTKHPGFVAFQLWSAVHMVPNGDVASLVFFGLMLGLSIYGPKSLNDKRRAQLGAERYAMLDQATQKGFPKIGLMRWALAGVLYLGLLYSHGPIIGVIPYSW